MTTDLQAPVRELVDELVGEVVVGLPGVLGALIASADGFVLSARLPEGAEYDAAAIAAMSAATLGLASRLVQLNGGEAAQISTHRSATAQVCVFAIGTSAVLTILADETADLGRVERVGLEITRGLAASM